MRPMPAWVVSRRRVSGEEAGWRRVELEVHPGVARGTPPPAPSQPPFAPGTPILTTAYFTATEVYFAGSHVTAEPEAATETAEITSSVGSTLMAHGLDVRTIQMTPTITTGYVQSIEWRIDLTYVGEPIAITAPFIASMGSDIAALGGPHVDSLWQAGHDLVTLSHAALR